MCPKWEQWILDVGTILTCLLSQDGRNRYIHYCIYILVYDQVFNNFFLWLILSCWQQFLIVIKCTVNLQECLIFTQLISIILDPYYRNQSEIFKSEEYHAGVILMRIPTNLFGLPKKHKFNVSFRQKACKSHNCFIPCLCSFLYFCAAICLQFILCNAINFIRLSKHFWVLLRDSLQ